MQSVLIVLLVLVAIAIVTLVLLQHGKGADIGASFGSGASSTVFGSQGSASFLMKLTLGLAAVFFVLSILLTRLASVDAKQGLNLELADKPATVMPVAPAPKVASKGNMPVVPSSKQ